MEANAAKEELHHMAAVERAAVERAAAVTVEAETAAEDFEVYTQMHRNPLDENMQPCTRRPTAVPVDRGYNFPGHLLPAA